MNLGTHNRQTDPAFQPFRFRSANINVQLDNAVDRALVIIQDHVPPVTDADDVIAPLVLSALASVGLWNSEMSRDAILEKGFIDWAQSDHDVPLDSLWEKRSQASFLGSIQYRWASLLPPVSLRRNDRLDLSEPRDGPSEVWSISSVSSLTGRRAVLSYRHDPTSDNTVKWDSAHQRRAVRLAVEEAEKVQQPTFLAEHSSLGLGDVWHDGMRYPSPDGQWNSYAGIIPYMMPGSAVWHLIPRLRAGVSPYPSTGTELFDRVIAAFVNLRAGYLPVPGLERFTVSYPRDRAYRDLSGVRRLWLMAEAVCGMLRDDLIISVQDLAGLALTMRHLTSVLTDLRAIVNSLGQSSEAPRGMLFWCIPLSTTTADWATLCSRSDSATCILRETLRVAGCDSNGGEEKFKAAVEVFRVRINVLKFWYSLLLGGGDVKNLEHLRIQVLEDLAAAPAWEEEDRPKVYFMIEAALINRIERHIPYEESIRRFMKAGTRGGELLINAVNTRSTPLKFEMTRAQMERMWVENLLAAWRNTRWDWSTSILRCAWLSGHPGLTYAGRFTTSASKPLYLEAAAKWAGYSQEDVIRMATEGKQRMVVMVTEKHRIFRHVDLATGTEILVCSVFFLDEEQHTLAVSHFGQTHFHLENKWFRGGKSLADSSGNKVDFEDSRLAYCLVNNSATWLEINEPKHLYQIVVAHRANEGHDRLLGIRVAENTAEKEKVAVSTMDAMAHAQRPGMTLFTARPDQISPDGRSIVDYSFEYENIWVSGNGHALSSASLQVHPVDDLIHQITCALRQKDWL